MGTPSALLVYSGGKPPALEGALSSEGFGLRSVASHRIERAPAAPPTGKPVARVVFTSRNAVEALRPEDLDAFPGARIHAVGEATLEALRQRGRAGEIPEVASAAGLLRALPARLDGERVFWPRGEDADLAFADELRRRGAEVEAPVVYRKVELPFPEGLESEIRERRYSAFACTSGAAASWLFGNLEPEAASALRSVPAAVLGEKTAEALRRLGAANIVPSEEASFGKLAKSLIALLRSAGQRSKT